MTGFPGGQFRYEATMRERFLKPIDSPKARRPFRRATVRYRCSPANPGRAFLANSSKCVEAMVVDLSLTGIGLILAESVEPGTLLGIEMGAGGKISYVDLVAHVMQTTQLPDGTWRCGCEWVHELTEEELQILR
jgi:hypothetical protein